MKILLLQDHIYLPSYGGGVKANRLLLEGLARRGHECAAMTPAFAPSAGPANDREFREEMERRGLAVHARAPECLLVSLPGGRCRCACTRRPRRQMREHVERRTRELSPDWVLVNDDKGRVLVAAALSAAGRERVVLVLQTITNTPFGPLAVAPSREHAQRMHEVRAIVTISDFLQRYVAELRRPGVHRAAAPRLRRRAVPRRARRDHGYVTMVNPCLEKGVDVFLPLARELPEVEFAAVRGWGTDRAAARRARGAAEHPRPRARRRPRRGPRLRRECCSRRRCGRRRSATSSRRQCSAASRFSRATRAACGRPALGAATAPAGGAARAPQRALRRSPAGHRSLEGGAADGCSPTRRSTIAAPPKRTRLRRVRLRRREPNASSRSSSALGAGADGGRPRGDRRRLFLRRAARSGFREARAASASPSTAAERSPSSSAPRSFPAIS